MRTIAIIFLALIGAFAGYLAGAYIACSWLWPASNLCGLPALFIACPFGLLTGGALANRIFPAKVTARLAHPVEAASRSRKLATKGQLESVALGLFGLLVLGVQFQLFHSGWFIVAVFVAMFGFILYFFMQFFK
jgi:MFS family permease